MRDDLTAGGVIERAFAIYRAHAGVLFGSALIVFAVEAAVALAVPLGVAALVSLVLTTFYQGMVVQLVHDVEDGRRDQPLGALLRSVSPVLGPLLVVSLLAAIGIAIGFVLVVVPGLILLTFWSVVAPVTVLERPGILAAFRRSRELVSGHGWTVFRVLLIVFAIVIAAAVVAGLVGEALGGDDQAEGVAGWLLNALVQPVSALTAAVLYFALRPPQRRPEPPEQATYSGFAPPV